MHPWLRLAWQHPERVTEHVAAYAALAGDEAGLALGRALARGRRQLVVGAFLVVGAVLAGTALLLWAALPALPEGRVWWLLAVPLAPILAAGWAWHQVRPHDPGADFAGLRAQLALDREAWDEARALEAPHAVPGGRP